MEKLSLILWRERELLETLLYRLEVEQLVMATGRTRWLATRRPRRRGTCSTRSAQTELLRAVAADEAAAAAGPGPQPEPRRADRGRRRAVALDPRRPPRGVPAPPARRSPSSPTTTGP